jgi:hypothetical protein
MCQPPALADDAHRGEQLLGKTTDTAISRALSGERAQSVHRLPCPRPRENLFDRCVDAVRQRRIRAVPPQWTCMPLSDDLIDRLVVANELVVG